VFEAVTPTSVDLAIERALAGLAPRTTPSPAPVTSPASSRRPLPASRPQPTPRALPPPAPKEDPKDVIRDVLGEAPDDEGPDFQAPAATPWFEKIRDAIVRTAKGRNLDRVVKAIYAATEQGLIDGEELRSLDAMVEIRRELPAIPRRNPHRFGSRPRTIDSRARRRRTFMGGWVPPHLAWHFTPGQLAVLSVVGREIVERGACKLYIDQIGAMAGVGRTLVKNALRIAEKLGMVNITERRVGPYRNLPNWVTLNMEGRPATPDEAGSPGHDWAAWLRHRRRTRERAGSDSFAASTPNQIINSVALSRDKVTRRPPTAAGQAAGGRLRKIGTT
jgi:hypothetical protein